MTEYGNQCSLILVSLLLSSCMINAQNASDINHHKVVEITAKINEPTVLDCHANADEPFPLFWLTSSNVVVSYDDSGNFEKINETSQVVVFANGSLFIREVTSKLAGTYKCMKGNSTATVMLRLDYSAVELVTVYSLLVGFSSAAGFFLIAVILGAVRYIAHVCSEEERAKRRTFKDVLAELRNSSHMERLSAYKVAKLDQFSTFRSATMDQLVAFKTAKIDKLRTYKCATVLSMQQYLDRMRDHYAAQTNRLKQNCTTRNQRLRANYTAQRRRLRGRKSVQVKRIKENYQARRQKIRDYSSSQMTRLRDQYKSQQQHVLKLLELLDIGNCMNTIRDDCQRTESAIFDSMFDLDLAGEAWFKEDDLDVGDFEEDSDDCVNDDNIEELDDLNDIDSDMMLDDAEFEMEDNSDNHVVTLEDILRDISDGVDLIRSTSVGTDVGSAQYGRPSRKGRQRFISLTVSLKDLHDDGHAAQPLLSTAAAGGRVDFLSNADKNLQDQECLGACGGADPDDGTAAISLAVQGDDDWNLRGARKMTGRESKGQGTYNATKEDEYEDEERGKRDRHLSREAPREVVP